LETYSAARIWNSPRIRYIDAQSYDIISTSFNVIFLFLLQRGLWSMLQLFMMKRKHFMHKGAPLKTTF